jgi:predicted metal-dependent phosphoesterase TrpH
VKALRLKLDLHVHSIYSADGHSTIKTINTRLHELGFDGYALADHDTIDGIKEGKKRAGDLTFIPALEVSAKGAHILALDPTTLVESNLSIVETVELIHDQGAIATLAHPFAFPRSWVRINQIEKAGFDAIEVANSAQIPYDYICGLNQRLADRLNLPATGGSDSHIPETVGRSYTLIESDSSDLEDVIKAIRLGRTSVGGSHTRITEWFSKNFRKKKLVTG